MHSELLIGLNSKILLYTKFDENRKEAERIRANEKDRVLLEELQAAAKLIEVLLKK